MSMRLADRILAPSRGDAAGALAFLDDPDAIDRAFVAHLWRWCAVAGVDFAIAFAWFCVETANATSVRWVRDHNPGGIGIPADSTVQPFAIPGGDEAARIHVQCYYAAVEGALHPDIRLWPEGKHWAEQVWLPKVTDAGYPYVARLTDLDIRYTDTRGTPHATWAWGFEEGQPAQSCIERAHAIWPDLPDQAKGIPVAFQFGNVTHPAFRDEIVPDGENGAWDNLGARKPCGVCQHSMVGSLLGTSGWFRRGNQSTGLTDYGIGGSTDGPQWDGVIVRWNDPTGRARPALRYTDCQGIARTGKASANRAGWANGGSDGLEGDGPLYVRTKGTNGINRDLVSIERSDGGDTGTPMSSKQFAAICALTAYWFDQARVRWDTFPVNGGFGIVTHLLHKEFATKDCPFPPVYDRIDEIQDRVRGILKAAQTLAVKPDPIPPANPIVPAHDSWAPYTEEALAKRYGTFPMTQPGGEEQTSNWDPKGSICNAWAARAKLEKIAKTTDIPPPLVGHIARDRERNTQTIVLFDGKGRDAWVLFRPAREVAWVWIR